MISDWKYRPPQLHNVLARNRVFRILDDRSRRRLILIRSKAGQGKTTLLADYLKRRGHESIWFRFTAAHRDVSAFVSEVCSGLESLQEAVAGRSGDTAEDAADRLTEALHSVSGKLLYVVFDDFELIGDSDGVAAVVETVIDRLPENIRLVILTRETPSMSLARPRLLQNLCELKDTDLAMNDEEGTELIREVFHLDIPEDTALRISRRTEGWATGIIFLLERLSSADDEGVVRELIDGFLAGELHREMESFFEDEVLDTVETELRDVLTSIGAFPLLSRELAEDLLGDHAAELLHRAAEKGLFITESESGAVNWIINPVFAGYLSRRFDELPAAGQEKSLRIAAGRYMNQGMVEQALPCLVRAGLFEEAKSRFVEYADELILGNKHLKIRDLLSVFPETQRKKDPYLEFYGLIADNLYHPYATKKKLLKLLPFFEEKGEYDRQATIYSVLLQNYFFYQENQEAVESLTRMTGEFLMRSGDRLHNRKRRLLEALLPLGEGWGNSEDEDSFEAALRAEETSMQLHDNESYLCSRLVLARKYIGRGDFGSAEKLLTRTLDGFGEDRYGRPYVSLISFYLGDIRFYSGDVHAAIREVQEGLANSSPEFAFRPYLEINLIIYNLYLQKFQNAEVLFETIRNREMGDNLYLRYFTAYLLQMLLAYRNENRRRASYYCRRLLEPENEILLTTDYPFGLIAILETAIWLEDAGLVGEVNTRLDDELDTESYPYPTATYYALQACWETRAGRDVTAGAALKKADGIMKACGYRNLEICNPELLYEIATMLGNDPAQTFPRIKSLAATHKLQARTAQLEIRTLGSFRLFADGEEIPDSGMISKKRVADLLKLLIIFRENGVRKELIYDLFWPKYSAKNSRDNLNTIFYRLRNILGKDRDYFEADSTTISFREGILDTDVDRFLQALKAGETLESQGETGPAIEMYTQAADTYAGDFLEGDLYSDYIRDERQMLVQKYVDVLFRLALLYLGSGDYLQALNVLKRLLEKDPICEPAVRLLMIASALLGSRNRIPQICDDLSRRLEESYGLEPDELTVALRNRLLSGEKPGPDMWKNEVIVS